jgi:hypothetical protein
VWERRLKTEGAKKKNRSYQLLEKDSQKTRMNSGRKRYRKTDGCKVKERSAE